MIHPSPAITVRADTSIAECLDLMNLHGVGSVIVVSDLEAQDPIGIFTERDLLRKLTAIRKGAHWHRPVRTVMSRPLRCLPLSQLERASELMIKHSIRHLPVVIEGPDGSKRLVGMVSMRDALRWAIALAPTGDDATEKAARAKRKAELTVSAHLKSTETIAWLKKLLSGIDRNIHLRTVPSLPEPGEKAGTPGKPEVQLVDLDNFLPKDWMPLLQEKISARNAPRFVVFYDPRLYPSRLRPLFEKLGTRPPFALFAKPVNLTALAELLRTT